MADGYDDSQIERMREQVRMSMGAMCDALSVTSVLSHGDPVAGTLDLNLESSVAMAVLGTSGSINSNMMVTLLDGASPDITDSEALVTQLEDAIDAMGQVLDSEIAAPSAASGHPTIAADISVPLMVDDATVGAVMVFLAPRETSGEAGAEPTAEQAVNIGFGVCQDHTHIFISVARLLGFPARYVSGHLFSSEAKSISASHAWAEAFVDSIGWIGFDISNGISPD